MLFDSEYKTISRTSEGIIKEKGSKFIAVCFYVTQLNDFKNKLADIKAQYPGAVHYCYAYRIGYNKQLFRTNDDGEPTGTASKPIYNVILSNDLTNIAIVVIRYFGGTLLGVPGLIAAYKQASIASLAENEMVSKLILEKANISFEYAKMNEVMKIIKQHQLKIIAQDYTTAYSITLEVPIKNAEQVRSAFSIYDIPYVYLETY